MTVTTPNSPNTSMSTSTSELQNVYFYDCSLLLLLLLLGLQLLLLLMIVTLSMTVTLRPLQLLLHAITIARTILGRDSCGPNCLEEVCRRCAYRTWRICCPGTLTPRSGIVCSMAAQITCFGTTRVPDRFKVCAGSLSCSRGLRFDTSRLVATASSQAWRSLNHPSSTPVSGFRV